MKGEREVTKDHCKIKEVYKIKEAYIKEANILKHLIYSTYKAYNAIAISYHTELNIFS